MTSSALIWDRQAKNLNVLSVIALCLCGNTVHLSTFECQYVDNTLPNATCCARHKRCLPVQVWNIVKLEFSM